MFEFETFFTPLAILIIGAFSVYVVCRALNISNYVASLSTSLVIITALIFLILYSQDLSATWIKDSQIVGSRAFGGIVYESDAAGIFIMVIGLVIGMLITIFSGTYLSQDPRHLLFYPLVLMTLAGFMGVFMSKNLFNLFLLMEITTIAASALIAFRYHQEVSIKAGFKYLIMSSIATMMMLLGIYFVYRSTGDMHIYQPITAPDNLTRVGAACFLLGFSLKAGVVPLHTWVPDVYGYAPSPVSGLLAGILSKSMLFIMPVICLRLGLTKRELGVYLILFSFINMLIGSIRMLRQPLLRRFLSFSSIGQTGYLMFALGLGYYYDLTQAFTVALFLFLVIAVMKSLAFLCVGIFEHHFGTQDIGFLQGAAKFFPLPSVCLSIALAGLAGIPLLAGFYGKWMIFSAAIKSGEVFSLIGLFIFIFSSVISLGGYLPVIVRLFQEADEQSNLFSKSSPQIKVSKWFLFPVVSLSVLVLVLGIFPGPFINWIDQVVIRMVI